MARHECYYPWKGMIINAMNDINVACCHYVFSGAAFDPSKGEDVRSFWNGSWFRSLRQCLARGEDLRGTGCEGCRELAVKAYTSFEIPEGLNSTQRENFAMAVESYRIGEELVAHDPCEYRLDFGRQCNLACIMCPQLDVRKQGKTPSLPFDYLKTQTEAFSKAERILFFGGEPLFIKDSRQFLQHMIDTPVLRDVMPHIVTNGQNLNDFVPGLEAFNRLALNMSIDAIGDIFEYIRRGAKWKRMEENVEMLVQLRSPDKNWSLGVNAAILKSSIPGLPDLVRWCVERGIDLIHFARLTATKYTINEDVLTYPELLKEIPGWENSLNEARGLCADAGYENAAIFLEDYISKLVKARGRECSTSFVEKQYEDVLPDTSTLAGKKVAIWGTGGYFRSVFSEWFEANVDKIDFQGFIDSNKDRWGKVFCGFRVIAPEVLQENSVDVVIVASGYREDIARRIEKMNVDGLVVV